LRFEEVLEGVEGSVVDYCTIRQAVQGEVVESQVVCLVASRFRLSRLLPLVQLLRSTQEHPQPTRRLTQSTPTPRNTPPSAFPRLSPSLSPLLALSHSLFSLNGISLCQSDHSSRGHTASLTRRCSQSHSSLFSSHPATGSQTSPPPHPLLTLNHHLERIQQSRRHSAHHRKY